MKNILIMVFCLFLGGCSSIAKGVTEAILDQKSEDVRQCQITGPEFPGVENSLRAQNNSESSKTTKILVVHGISRHLPGYSTQFKDKLVRELGLELASEGYKEIIIQHKDFVTQDGQMEDIGVLRVTRHQNLDRSQDLLFYELTWSQISDPEREELDFDTSGEYSYRRAAINQTLKAFVNETVPDLMVYRGESKKKINLSVAQAVCWTFAGDWNDLPSKGTHFCDATEHDFSKHILEDDYFFVTHSLGSRITVDTLAYAEDLSKQLGSGSAKGKKFFDALKQKEFQVYMLSNQLPLLQLGLKNPEVTEQREKYCQAGGTKYQDRIFEKINLIAFSDPNDILSYPIPQNYSERKLDSRLCADIVNVNINVADVNDALGVSFANPLDAHGSYWKDDRVIALIKGGVSRNNKSPLIQDKCQWTQTLQ